MTAQPDLLTLSRTGPAPQVSPPPRRWLLRVGIPVAVIAAVAALLLYTARGALVPATEVRVAPVVALPSGAAAPAGAAPQVLVQAPGWVEADPYAISVPALTAGVVKEVLVLEGQRVEKDQVVATLVDEDARLAHKRSTTELEAMTAELAVAQANHAAAVNRAAEVRDEVDRKRGLVQAGGISEGQFARLELRLRAMEQELEGAQAAIAAAQARVRQREVAREETALALERTQVRAPAPGVVLERLVEPGARVSMEGAMPGAVVRLYDPSRLQVRVDVPIAEAAKVGLGTPADVVTEALPDAVFKGEITRLVHEADIQRNTVQVKVALHDPSPTLKPEMLTRVRFMGTPQPGATAAAEHSQRFLIPADAVVREATGAGHVFIVDLVDPAGPAAARRSITFAPAQQGLVQASGDLREGDRVILEPLEGLRDGRRIRVAGEWKGAR